MFAIKNKIGLFAVFVLSFLPVILWIIMRPIGERFVDWPTAMTSLGQITGLVGITIFASVLILSGRLKWLEDYFGGLDKIYVAHHFFGSLAFILMLSHPLFLAGGYLSVSVRSAALFLLPRGDWSVNFGILALMLAMVFLVLTFFIKLPYEKWKKTHKFLGLAFFFAGLHGLLMPSDISRFLPLRVYVFSLALVGISVYCWRTVFGRFFVKRLIYTVSNIKHINDKVIEIEMSPKDNNHMRFIPGQFLFVSFLDAGIGFESHPFSIASSPTDGSLKIAVKALGDFTDRLPNLKSGVIARIEGPFGRFFSQNQKDQVWIAGGIGITPFLSMARHFKQDNAGKIIHLFYCAPSQKEAIFLDELSEISAHRPNFKIFPFFSGLRGNISAEHIKNTIGDLKNKEIFLCGPPPMMKSLKSQFLRLGVFKANIHSEEFQLR